MNKACPVLLRNGKNGYEILAFKHPLAGNQIVKGTIEPNETLKQASIRELKEESGVIGEASQFLGKWSSGYENHVWGFYLMSVNSPLPNSWKFFTEDDGGHEFEFFWYSLNKKVDEQWHPLFKGAVNFIKNALAKSLNDEKN